MLCIAGLGSVINIKADEYVYDNDSDVSIKSNIDGQKWDIDSNFLSSISSTYPMEYVINSIGGHPYYRLGKEGYPYVIYATNDNPTAYLILTFDFHDNRYENSLIDGLFTSKLVDKTLFIKYVKVGTPIEEVKLIDPRLDIISFPNTEDMWAMTEHRFADETVAHCTYKKDSDGVFKIVKVDLLSPPFDYKIIGNLLDKDYALIENKGDNEEEFLRKLKELREKSTTNPYSSSQKLKKPSKVKIISVKRKKKKIIVRYKKAKNAKKYQIQYATNRKFKKAQSKYTKKTKYTIKKISKKKTYYIRVRGINKSKKGKWSKTKKR